MVDIEGLKREILERLRPLNPELVILFGSYAHGNPTEDSGIAQEFSGESRSEAENVLPRNSFCLASLQLVVYTMH